MNNRFRQVNQFFVMSGSGKVQSGFDVLMNQADLDTLENCEVEMSVEVTRGEQRNCDKTDLIGQPTKSRKRQVRLRYAEFTAHQAFKFIALKEGAVTNPTGTAQDEVQTLTRSGAVSGGSFTLSISLEGRTGSTKAIPYNATTAQIQAALTNAVASIGKIIKPGDVTVGGTWGGGITLTFTKRLAKANLPLLSVDNTSITGGGTVVNTQTTAGGNKYHTAQRSADGSKPHFCFAMGEKSGSVLTRIYKNAVVSSVDFNISNQQTNPEMIVVLDCDFNPEEVSGFDVPECINLVAVKSEDFRIQFSSTYENRDLVSDTVSLNDNVPTNAAFVFDEIDVTRAFQRGDRPTQETNTEFFGDQTHPVYQLAEEEYVDDNEISVTRHYGNPGRRFSILAPETKIKPQGGSLEGFSGELRESTVRINGTPFGKSGLPVTYEAYLDQTTAFLLT